MSAPVADALEVRTRQQGVDGSPLYAGPFYSVTPSEKGLGSAGGGKRCSTVIGP
jgi:hypothetical protein